MSPNKSDKNPLKSKKPIKNESTTDTCTDTDTDTLTKNTVEVSKNNDSSHKKVDCHLDTPDTSTLSTLAENKKSGTKKDKNSLDDKIKKHTHFKCITCNAGEFGINEKGTNKESILQFHKKLGHSIHYFNQKEGVTS